MLLKIWVPQKEQSMPCCIEKEMPNRSRICGKYVSFYRKFNLGSYCTKHIPKIYKEQLPHLQKAGSYYALFKDVMDDKGIIVAVTLAIVDFVQSAISITDSPGIRKIFHNQPIQKRDCYRISFVFAMFIFGILCYTSYFCSWAQHIISLILFIAWFSIVIVELRCELIYKQWIPSILLIVVLLVLATLLMPWSVTHGVYISFLFVIPQILTILTVQIGTLLFSKHFRSSERSILFALFNYLECIVLFSLVYLAIDNQFKPCLNNHWSLALYYSIITITTLGYGDIEPTKWLARMVSGVESLVGIFFIALVIAFFLSHLSENKR